MYQDMIKEILERKGHGGKYDPRHIEGYMRLEHGCLDGLYAIQFAAEVEISRQCIDAGGIEAAESLAKSFGL